MEEKKELLDQDERVVEIELERLRGFVNHPFKVQADSQMIELQESIKKYGILNPLIVRPRQDGTYEIISGHRRKFAAEKIGYRKVPVIIRVLKDDEAVVSMVDSNLQREMISPSEKAFAYKMKYEAIKRKAGRRKCGQVDHNLGKKSIAIFLQSFIVQFLMYVLSAVIFVIINGRMVEIYLMVSLAPLPFATFGNREQSMMGQNYMRSLFALGFQGFLIMVCVGIYAVLIQSVAFSTDIIASLWKVMGFTILLAFTLFKTGAVAHSIFHAH